MLWEVCNTTRFDFFSELQKKLEIKNLKDYDIITLNIHLIDQEDFYGAILKYLKENENDKPMRITIRKKCSSD